MLGMETDRVYVYDHLPFSFNRHPPPHFNVFFVHQNSEAATSEFERQE